MAEIVRLASESHRRENLIWGSLGVVHPDIVQEQKRVRAVDVANLCQRLEYSKRLAGKVSFERPRGAQTCAPSICKPLSQLFSIHGRERVSLWADRKAQSPQNRSEERRVRKEGRSL